jgi:hypothetical protein
MSIWTWFGYSAPAPTFTEDTTKFLDFYPTTCATCKPLTEKLFQCLSEKSAGYLKSTNEEERIRASEIAASDCKDDLVAYNVCMLTHFQKKGKTITYKAFRVSFKFYSWIDDMFRIF